MLQRATGLFLLGILTFAFFPLRSSAASSPNIILITMESTRADRMGFLGAHAKLTPHLDGLARECIVFERAYAQSPLTVVSHATILSGTYPQTHQASELGAPLSSEVPFLPSLLHTRGYRTAAFVGAAELNPREGFAPGFDRGFDIYDAPFHQRGADRVAASATKWLGENSGKPFFLWVQLDDANALSGALYDRAVAGVDAAVGKIVTALRSLKIYDNSVLVVASDHGESLGTHGEDTHGIFLYDETIRVALLVKLPQGQLAGKSVRGRVRLLDIAPTVLEAARVPVPSQMQGQSLLRIASASPGADQPVYARSDFSQQALGWSPLESWRAGKYLYIRAPKPELYDLAADPGATQNLAQSSKATLDTIATQLEAFRSHFDKEHGKTTGSGLTSSEMQKLASLGYVGLQKSASDAGPAMTGVDPKDGIATANQILNVISKLAAGKADGAVPVLEQAIKAYPNAYLAHYEMGVVLAQQQRYPQAIEHLHRAIELQPSSVWAHYAMGESLVKTGDFKTAVVHLELVCGRLPKFREAHLLLAESYDHLGQSKQAQVEREKASR
jgi:arylsulfatase A-like enzyme/Flp pilus assembly protein TadD